MSRLRLRQLSDFHEARRLMQERFRLEGDLDDFYNPFNICIHKVLTRGLGVPVSLGVVWMALGRLCGLDVRGTRMPGHFMMRFSDGAKVWFVDPFTLSVHTIQRVAESSLQLSCEPGARSFLSAG